MRRLNDEYLGTIIKGGCDGLTRYPEKANRKTFAAMRAIGENFGRTGAFDQSLLGAFARSGFRPCPVSYSISS